MYVWFIDTGQLDMSIGAVKLAVGTKILLGD